MCPCARYCGTVARADIVCTYVRMHMPTRTGMHVRGRVRVQWLNRGRLIARIMYIFFMFTPPGHPPAIHLKPYGAFSRKSRAPVGAQRHQHVAGLGPDMVER